MTTFYKKLNLVLDSEDRDFLNYLVHTYVNKIEDVVVHGHTPTHQQYQQFFIRKSDNNYRDKNIFKKIANLFKPGIRLNSVDEIYYTSQISYIKSILTPHIDERKSVLTIPLTILTEPVYWYDLSSTKSDSLKDKYTKLESYNYDCTATLINTSILHGSPDNNSPRILFQVSFSDNIETVIDSLI